MKISIDVSQEDLDVMGLDSSNFIDAIKFQILNAVDDEGNAGEDWLSNIDLRVNLNGRAIHQTSIITDNN